MPKLFVKGYLIKNFEHPVYPKKSLSSAENDKMILAQRYKKVTDERICIADFEIKKLQLFFKKLTVQLPTN